MERSSRIITCLQTLEKITLSGQKATAKFGPDDLQQVRFITSKILQYLQTQDKSQRDIIMKNSSYIDLILMVLENANDTLTEHNLVLVLGELIGKSQTNKRVSTLVSHGATHVLFHILVLESKEANSSEELLITIHQVLAKIGQKDRKFGVKARLSQALGVTLGLLRSYITSPKLLQPVVQVLKLYSNNVVNASYLGKNGAVSYLFKILAVSARKHLILCKTALDTLALLVKSKSNSARAIGQGGVGVLLTMFYDWHKVDSKNRHVSLRKSILTVLKHVTNLKSGRKALMEADGIRVLWSTCQDSVDCRELESVIFMASIIMRKCFPKNRLPLSSLKSPLSCPLPQSDFHVPETGEGQDGLIPPDSRPPRENSIVRSLDTNGDENGYESSIDNDDDISSDEDLDPKLESDEDGGSDRNNGLLNKRTTEDLQMYNKFFKELFEFDIILEEEAAQGPEQPIIIPTAFSDLSTRLISQNPSSRRATSLVSLQGTSRHAASSNGTPLYNSNNDYLFTKISDRANRDFNRDSDSDCLGNILPRSRLMNNNKPFFVDNQDPFCDVSQGPSAVNLKTGSSVFTLDFSSSQFSKKPVNSQNRSPKMRRKSNKPAKTKEKKKPVKSKTDDWNGFDTVQNSISVLAYNRDAQDDDDFEGNDECGETEDARGFLTRDNPEVFADIASKTKSVGRFNKLAYPDMFGHEPPPFKEALHEKKFGIQRQKIFEDIDRFINPENTIDRTVYDLDAIVTTAGPTYCDSYSNYTNRDDIRVTRQEDSTDHLKFNSQFECGNLRKAIQIRRYEYDLILNPDVNTNHHHQWFYFEISNMEASVKYRFNIVNCEKLNSQFNFGMRPVMFSVAEALQGRPYWARCGSEICYYKNHFERSTQTTGGLKGKTYYTTTFSISFKHEKDVCYLAYHYPYSYSMMQYHLYQLESVLDSEQIYYRHETLCETICGNPVPVLTITSHPPTYDREGVEQFKNRPYIFLSSRVHPGESNSSWVMKGTISYLLSNKPSAQALRDMYIFKIVPMLNPDGVINGTHRCSLVAEDLNRRWLNPCPKLHPTIYHTKGLLQYMQSINKTPLVFCDYHGHSRKKNVFLYGCSPSLSWLMDDANNPAFITNKMEDSGYKTLPKVLQNIAPTFSLNNCSFVVEKSKESTARVVVWRQIGVVRSYTMESSYCGCDQGPYRGQHISTKELEEMGRKFCEGLAKVKSRHARAPPVSYTFGNHEPLGGNSQDLRESKDLVAQCISGGNGRTSRNDLESILESEFGQEIQDTGGAELDLHGNSLDSDSSSQSEAEEAQDEYEEGYEEIDNDDDNDDDACLDEDDDLGVVDGKQDGEPNYEVAHLSLAGLSLKRNEPHLGREVTPSPVDHPQFM